MPRSGSLPLLPVSGCVIGAQAPFPAPGLSGVRDMSEVIPSSTYPIVPRPPGYLFSQPLELKGLVTLCLTGQRKAAALLTLRGWGAHPDIRHIWGHSNNVSLLGAGQGRVPLAPAWSLELSPSPSQFTSSSCWPLSSDAMVSKSRP